MSIMSFMSGDTGWPFIFALLPLPINLVYPFQEALRADAYRRAERQFLLHRRSLGVRAGPESSEASIMRHGLAGIDFMRRAVAGRASRRWHRVGIVQHVAGIAKHAFGSQAIIVFPVLAEILMRRMAEQSYFGRGETARSIE